MVNVKNIEKGMFAISPIILGDFKKFLGDV